MTLYPSHPHYTHKILYYIITSHRLAHRLEHHHHYHVITFLCIYTHWYTHLPLWLFGFCAAYYQSLRETRITANSDNASLIGLPVFSHDHLMDCLLHVKTFKGVHYRWEVRKVRVLMDKRRRRV